MYNYIARIYNKGHKKLIDFNMELLRFFLVYFDIEVELVYSSSLEVEGTKTTKLVNIVSELGGDVYLTGIGSRDYLDECMFLDAGIKVEWQDFKERPYRQLHGDFSGGLSCIDFAMNCGSGIRLYLDGYEEESRSNFTGADGLSAVLR